MARRLRLFLLDTNIWLERLLSQKRSDEVGRFLSAIPSERLCITDFSLHSVGIILSKERRQEAFKKFVCDLFLRGRVRLIHLEPQDMMDVADAMEQFGLDFDDAYQYVAAKKDSLVLVSFDSDFDRADIDRMEPQDVLM